MDDAKLWEAFGTQSLSDTEYTHEAHLRTAFVYASRFDLDEAHLRMRVGIIRLNASHGLVETGMRGYHETLTRVWLSILDQAHDAWSRAARRPRAQGASAVMALAIRTRLTLTIGKERKPRVGKSRRPTLHTIQSRPSQWTA